MSYAIMDTDSRTAAARSGSATIVHMIAWKSTSLMRGKASGTAQPSEAQGSRRPRKSAKGIMTCWPVRRPLAQALIPRGDVRNGGTLDIELEIAIERRAG